MRRNGDVQIVFSDGSCEDLDLCKNFSAEFSKLPNVKRSKFKSRLILCVTSVSTREV